MSRTISEQAAINIVEFECGEWRGLASRIVEAIKQLPSAEPERKPRQCKDCGHFDEELEFCDVFEWCNDGSEFYNRAEQKNVKVDFNK